MNQHVLNFLLNLEEDKLSVPSKDSVEQLIIFYDKNINVENKEEWFTKGLVSLSYFLLNEHWTRYEQRDRVTHLIDNYLDRDHDLVHSFISALKPMLIKSTGINNDNLTPSGRRKIESSRPGLQPRLGFEQTFGESRWKEWRTNGGLRSIGLFYIILRHLGKQEISANLPWISPGILNIIDDTTLGPENVRVYGIMLLCTLLESVLNKRDTYNFNFKDTGLQKVYEPILTNLLYNLPPSSTPEETLRTWKVTYPALQLILRVEASDNDQDFRDRLGHMFSENILQLTIPRIGLDYPGLSLWILGYCQDVVLMLGKETTLYLQRVIYVLGEFYFRNAFMTLQMPILHKCLDLLILLCDQCIPESIVNQRYDILACILLCYEKCYNEGSLTADVLDKCKVLLAKLESFGCDFKEESKKLKERKSLTNLFA
ncbi:Tti2p [Kluyveromyces lactis]|uniref:KLLA0B04026p n=1 Tax=Kluyveromyces lactis (strain ATCC 8585 / CBS 2359 / DSM 70799 / NBRC 1267 / NRRL Y-1140 / WM37) TaxID=284590 RepID=Q6CWH6_KLULA|nr:uncharacterized protein KLLA0_B04026g [Kluyveromyces lactis]CAH02106.1 KLLA0B04026p [Kluyveromyces lactis]|eukprot:XP_451713.1 uncharacterized protein KLLA0_B04026g [Kluyveromyces lactis]